MVMAGTLHLDQKRAIVGEWVARTLGSYPEQTARLLLQQKDPFRNPAGHLFTEGLPALFEQLTGGWEQARVREILDPIIRLRAVQDFTPSQAVGFVLLLKQVIREQAESALTQEMSDRIDQLALLAFDLFMKCREEAYEIRAREARRLAEGVRFRMPAVRHKRPDT